ncbi:MAG: DUF4388 domain-containing protein [Nitriliruptorales bacterium]|nr:DUF4388 domain-containing protein [Nitriliruptorales bacterium]
MLAGTLNDVSLPEILSLLSHSEKTGSVHVVGDGLRGRIDLISGAIGMVQSQVGKLGLVRRLVAKGALTAEVVAPDLAAAAATPDPDIQLVRSAYRAGAVTAEQVKEVVWEHMIDAMYDLGRVEAGRFRFDPGRVADLGVQRPPEELLDDVAVRTEEWEQIRASIPAPGALVRMLPRIEQEAVEITPPTWRLLAAIDGRRTVADLVEVLGDGEFEVSSALHRLVGAGLVEVTVAIKDDADPGAADTLLPLELELAELRSDPKSTLSGRLDWDTAATGPDAPAAEIPSSDQEATTDTDLEPATEAATADHAQATTAESTATDEQDASVVEVEPVAMTDAADGAPETRASAPTGPVESDESEEPAVYVGGDTSATGVVAPANEPIEDWTGTSIEVDEGDELGDEPEVFTTVVDDADEDDARASRRRQRRSPPRKVSLAATSERHGRLLPEPEPGHDAADLTRRLLEGVGKS